MNTGSKDKECCEKWRGAEAVPTYSPVELIEDQYAKKDPVNYCPVCGNDLRGTDID